MPHSPYRKTIYPPISNLDEFRQGLAHHRVSWESGERDKQRDELLLDIGEVLVEHCDFLEEKLAIKKRECSQLTKENDALKTELEDWKKEIEAQEMEIDAFQSKLEKLGAALEAVKQMDTGADGVYAETDIGKPVKPEKESE